MILFNLFEERNPRLLSPKQRHMWAKFIYNWVIGKYMLGPDKRVSQHWINFAKNFPHDLKKNIVLYRVVTIPKSEENKLRIKASPHNNVSSWSSSLSHLDSVLNVADDLNESEDNMRVAVKGFFKPNEILATPETIRNTFLSLTHDYFHRFPSVDFKIPSENGRPKVYTYNKGYRSFEPDDSFNMDEVDYYQANFELGEEYDNYQDEYICYTPHMIDVEVVKVYRFGDDWLDS